MPVKITYDFTTERDAIAFLSGRAAPASVHIASTTQPQTLTQTASTQTVEPVQTMVLPGTHTAAPVEITAMDAQKAMMGYIQRGNGHTALTARAIMQQHGAESFKVATPQQLAAIKLAYETAP